ncbi:MULTISPECIES: hypothetical protein [Enterobacterales]|uniref:Uncharacterized protein n=7 Tax=Morganellaceae TaxID=1903414 RepID=A0A899NER7_PROST|nr:MULTISPECIES: hypothetical protein [Enterobacterales]EKH6498537.1 hypothetical protein [Providencia rettgeri]ELB1111364.1 hypothetical protein [Morganella morganii]ELL8907276.1 hypothetical protein [Proteus mirabilis]ELQ1458496.1 hypothetical protein [Providencia rettgeri]ELR5042554.1 hypothetical protein [Providencia rettgeri]
MSQEYNPIPRNVMFTEFLQLLEEDGLPASHLETVRKIFAEITQQVNEFGPERGALLALAEAHSPFYRDLKAEKDFISGVLNMPIFFHGVLNMPIFFHG